MEISSLSSDGTCMHRFFIQMRSIKKGTLYHIIFIRKLNFDINRFPFICLCFHIQPGLFIIRIFINNFTILKRNLFNPFFICPFKQGIQNTMVICLFLSLPNSCLKAKSIFKSISSSKGNLLSKRSTTITLLFYLHYNMPASFQPHARYRRRRVQKQKGQRTLCPLPKLQI